MKHLVLFTCMAAIVFNVNGQGKTTTTTQPTNPKITKRKLKTDELQNVNDVYYFNGKPFTGTTVDLFPDGKKMQEINWVNGELEGTKTEYFEDGVSIRSIVNFKAGKANGDFIYYHPTGFVKTRGKYVMDVLDSTINAFFDNGNPKYVHHYQNGVLVGELITYYKNGNVEQKVSLKNEKPHGLMLSYYEAGNLRREAYYNEGIRNGPFVEYHMTGTRAEESYYKNGVLDSVSRYWDNVFGTLMKEQYYKMGKKDGVWYTFNIKGDTITMFTYKDDVLNGPYKKYFDGFEQVGDKNNGRGVGKDTSRFDPKKYKRVYVSMLDEYGTYVNGKLDGEFKTGLYHREAHAEGTYSMGVMVGEWKYWDENDQLVLHEKYDDEGNLIYQKPKLKK